MEFHAFFFSVLHKRCVVEQPPSFLAENNPFRIIGIAPLQIANPSYRSFLHNHTVFYGKPCLFQTFIMVWITVKPGKKIRMGIRFQNPVALMCKQFIIYSPIPVKYLMLGIGKIILVGNSIRGIGEYH